MAVQETRRLLLEGSAEVPLTLLNKALEGASKILLVAARTSPKHRFKRHSIMQTITREKNLLVEIKKGRAPMLEWVKMFENKKLASGNVYTASELRN